MPGVKGPAQVYEGKPCKHGHGSLRYLSTGHCVVCQRQRSKAKYAAKKKAQEKDPE